MHRLDPQRRTINQRNITNGIDIIDCRAHMPINQNTITRGRTGGLCQRRIRRHANANNQQFGGDMLAIGKCDAVEMTIVVMNICSGRTDMNLHPVLLVQRHEKSRHIRAGHPRQQAIGGFDNMHV